MIVSAFPGCGKTTLGEKYKNIIDLESSLNIFLIMIFQEHKLKLEKRLQEKEIQSILKTILKQ